MRNPSIAGLLPPLLFLLAVPGTAQHWNQVNPDGFGNPTNLGVVLAEYNGELFGATLGIFGSEVRRYTGSSWVFEQSFGLSNPSVFDPTVFQGELYLGTFNQVTGCEVWRRDAAGNYARIDPGAPGPGGFGDTTNIEVSGMGVLNNVLYVGTQHVVVGPTDVCVGAEVWSFHPLAPVPWQQVPVPWGATTCEADGFVEHLGKLFVGVTDETVGCEVWSFDGAVWTQEHAAGFGDGAAQTDARGMAVCGGDLYVGTENSATGCEVWRYDGAPFAWTRVADQGFGLGPAANEEVLALTCFGGSLFAGTEGAASVWRYDGGTSWTKVAPDGFGDGNNAIIGSLVEHAGQLHAGTFNQSPPGNGCEVWRHEVHPYGCASPEESLVILGGTPTQTQTLTFGVDDPSGGASSPSTAFLAVALGPDPNFPCGTVLGSLGELLISVLPPNPVFVLASGTPWTAPGTPVTVDVPVPLDPTLVSLSIYLQGALVGTKIRLTQGFRVVIV